MDIIGKKINTGFAVLETKRVVSTVNGQEVKKIKAIFTTREAAKLYMRDLLDSQYDDPLEYNRYLLDHGNIIRREYLDPETDEVTEVTEWNIEECGLIL